MRPLSPLPPLLPGDIVRVLAPAGVFRSEINTSSLEMVRKCGLEVQLDHRLHHVDPEAPYLAGTDSERVAALTEAIVDPEVRAIFCARGGYGTMRILPHLDPALLRQNPKPILGFSDITALLSFAAVSAGIPSIHAPLFKTLHTHLDLNRDPFASSHALLDILLGKTPNTSINTLQPLQNGHAHAPIVGGNLALVCALLTTPWSLPLQGAILYLEDVHESPYRLDRMFTTLALGGHLSALAGLVIGDLDPVPDAYLSARDALSCVQTRIRELAQTYIDGPVAFGLPIGHGAHNLPMPFGTLATLYVEGEAAKLDLQHAIASR